MVARPEYPYRCLVPGIPVAQGRPRASVRGGNIFMRDPEKSRSWKNCAAVHMRASMQRAGLRAFVGPLEARVRCYWPSVKPDRKRHPRKQAWRDKRPDADNLAKAALDAAQGVVYSDDAQVVRLIVEKFHAAQGDVPRVVLEVRKIASWQGLGSVKGRV